MPQKNEGTNDVRLQQHQISFLSVNISGNTRRGKRGILATPSLLELKLFIFLKRLGAVIAT